ncbi:MAG TPA: NAD(P)H-dependent oxidoreductase subunit E [Elusimicrobiota bacterium]|nr:NAD(P)H-dependent oxidoreductase subunit E [Elusimicrobiota bacterium]
MDIEKTDIEDIRRNVEEICAPWEGRPGNLIMILHQIQNRYSYVPRRISFEVAKRLSIPLARIYEVITFYNYFKLEPPGKNIVSVCMGTACYLKGAPSLVERLGQELGIKPGESTRDKNFYLQVVRCLGCCGLAPVLTVGQKVYSNVRPEQVPGILAEYRQGAVV